MRRADDPAIADVPDGPTVDGRRLLHEAVGFGLVTAIAQELPALDPSRQHPNEVNGTIVRST